MTETCLPDKLRKNYMTMKKISEEIAFVGEVLAPHRSVAYDAVTDIMLDALTELSEYLNGVGEEAGDGLLFDRPVCGFRPEQLEKVCAMGKENKLVSWMSVLPEVERMALMMSFLDWDRLRLQEFRQKYPKSFTKWEADEDEALLEMYPKKKSWRELSSHFGRNVNAVKLRLQHLGVDLGAEAGRARFMRRQ